MIRVTHVVLGLLSLAVILLGGTCLHQRNQLAKYRQQEKADRLDLQLAGLRIPYEALLFHPKWSQEINKARFNTCKEYGFEAITPYSSVLRDEDNKWQVVHSGMCANASFENYWWNHFFLTCRQVLAEMENQRGEVYEAVARHDARTLACLRLHLGRALGSRVEGVALSACRLWLQLFEPTTEVKKSLARLIELPRLMQVTSEDTVGDYSSWTIEAAQIIDAYHLDVAYPAEIKASPKYRGRSDKTGENTTTDTSSSRVAG